MIRIRAIDRLGRDWPAIVNELWRLGAFYAQPFSAAEKIAMAVTLHPATRLMVAERGLELAGAVSFHARWPEAKVANLGAFPQRQGAGRALMIAVAREAVRFGVPLWLNANWQAREFYVRLGFLPMPERGRKAMILPPDRVARLAGI